MKCEYCSKEYKGKYRTSNERNLRNHIIHCDKNPNRELYKCKFCEFETDNFSFLGSHTTNCEFNPNYDRNKKIQKINGMISIPHKESTKKKISIARKKFLKENPDKVPYLINHSSNDSYPEKYFESVFENENIETLKKFRIHTYELDFAIPDKKIDIEIDGEQHYSDDKIVESDLKRNKYLEDRGWDVIRIRWSSYQKLKIEEKKLFINDVKNYINKLIDIKPNIKYEKLPKNKDKCECGELKTKSAKNCKSCYKKNNKKSKKNNIRMKYICKHCKNECTNENRRCRKCYEKQNRKVKNRPTITELLSEVEKSGYSATGRKYNVSDVTIRKWIKNEQIKSIGI
jgi:very-short-patch-repair endonuclease